MPKTVVGFSNILLHRCILGYITGAIKRKK